MALTVRMITDYDNRGKILNAGEAYIVDRATFKMLIKGKHAVKDGDPIPRQRVKAPVKAKTKAKKPKK